MTIFIFAQMVDEVKGLEPYVMLPDSDVLFQEGYTDTFELTDGGKVIVTLPLVDDEYDEEADEIPVVFRGFEIPSGYDQWDGRWIWGGAYAPRNTFLLIPELSELVRALADKGFVYDTAAEEWRAEFNRRWREALAEEEAAR
jgi:hypothetical protein